MRPLRYPAPLSTPRARTSRRPSQTVRIATTMLLVVLALASGARAAVAQVSGAAARTAPRPADPAADREAVRRAALDYIEGFYEGDSTKHVRSVRADFYKYGFYFNPDSARYEGSRMTWAGAMDFDRRVRASNRPTPPSAPKEVQIFEVSDQTASAKVRAWWGIDYLLLGKYDGRWMISHVLWQSPPSMP